MSRYVLVVDDNPSDLLLTSAHVEMEEFVVVQAVDGFDALDKLEEFEFSLFILDLQMPNMGGLELMKRLKRMEIYKNIPVLVTSAKKESQDVQAAIKTGAKDYLVKPLDGLIFKEKFNRIVGSKDEWTEYKVEPETPLSKGFVQKPLEILSISEVGVTACSSEEWDVDSHFQICLQLFGEESLRTFNAKVESCEKDKDQYQLKFIFFGLTEEIRKKIRLTCREIWNESKREKKEEE